MAVDADSDQSVGRPVGDLGDEVMAEQEVQAQAEDDVAADDAATHSEPDGGVQTASKAKKSVRLAVAAMTAVIVALAALAVWLVQQVDAERNAQHVDDMFVQVGRQAAVNLSTIDYNSVDVDVQRILDSSTGTFYNDFNARADAFRNAIREAKSTSEGTVTVAGLESIDGDHAQVVVAVQVRTTVAGSQDPEPRAWRMRVAVQKIGDTAKVENVEFVA